MKNKSSKKLSSLRKKISITITKTDIANAKSYVSNTDCFLATALKRLSYPKACVSDSEVEFIENSEKRVYLMNAKDSNNIVQISKANPKRVRITLTEEV